jgi:hypothetical protein
LAQAIKHVPSKCAPLSSTPSTIKKKKKKKKEKKGWKTLALRIRVEEGIAYANVLWPHAFFSYCSFWSFLVSLFLVTSIHQHPGGQMMTALLPNQASLALELRIVLN